MFKSHSRVTFNICHIHMFKVRATSCINTGLSQAGNEQGHKLIYFCPGKRMKGLGDIWQSSWGVDPEFYNKECACVDNEASSSDVQRSTSSRHWFHEGRKVPGSLDVFSKIRTLEKENPRMVFVGQDLQDYPVPPPCYGQGTPSTRLGCSKPPPTSNPSFVSLYQSSEDCGCPLAHQLSAELFPAVFWEPFPFY